VALYIKREQDPKIQKKGYKVNQQKKKKRESKEYRLKAKS
jgi:hypothetical protein